MNTKKMQLKYDFIASYIKDEDIPSVNEYIKLQNDNGSDEYIPSVHAYVKYAISNTDFFLAYLFNDFYIYSEDDLTRKQRSELADFVRFCERTDNQKQKVITEHGEDIDVFECRCDLLSYEYKGKQYDISGEFYIDNDGYLHHTHCDDDEEFEIKYLLH